MKTTRGADLYEISLEWGTVDGVILDASGDDMPPAITERIQKYAHGADYGELVVGIDVRWEHWPATWDSPAEDSIDLQMNGVTLYVDGETITLPLEDQQAIYDEFDDLEELYRDQTN